MLSVKQIVHLNLVIDQKHFKIYIEKCVVGKSLKGMKQMDAYERLKATAATTIIRDIPSGYWEELRARGLNVYADTFAEVEADPNVHPDQKIDDLLQRRHFRMENLLVQLAVRHGLLHSMNLIVQNNRRHAYVYCGDVGMTQSYVQAIGDMPHPAKFREKLANSMGFPRLDLGDEPPGAFVMRNLYGLIAHNPVGRRFDQSEQRLGMMQFCLPSNDCKSWALEFTISEILGAYPSAVKQDTIKRSPSWKKPKDDKGTGTEESK